MELGTATRARTVNKISPTRIWLARIIAVGADLLQIVLFPLFSEGFISPIDDALDVVVCALLTMLVGWHFAFLPSFVVKVVPLADLVPTWTLAIIFATRQKQPPREEKIARAYENEPARPPLQLPPER
ncbi:MAG: hypothetical protein JWR26_3185 [Pedosphaera sp.]|nr:hypothetical protein [Pedosphaera sp.]